MVRERAILDASVAVRWFVEEPGDDAALTLFKSPIHWVAPRLLLTEVAGALARKVSLGEIRPLVGTRALAMLGQMTASRLLELAEDESHIGRAFKLAVELDHRVADCLYLALAEAMHLPIVTADEKLARFARGRKIGASLVPSS